MKRTFASEDTRKDQLFRAWIKHLDQIHCKLAENDFEEFYEGTALVSGLSQNCLDIRLEDGRSVRQIQITPEIRAHTVRLDLMYVVLGRLRGTWWPLDLISVGSTIDNRGIHMTYNPLIVDPRSSRRFH